MKKVINYFNGLFTFVSLVCFLLWVISLYLEVFNIKLEINKSILLYSFLVFGIRSNILFLRSLIAELETIPSNIYLIILNINEEIKMLSLNSKDESKNKYIKVIALLVKLFFFFLKSFFKKVKKNFYWQVTPYLFIFVDLALARFQFDFITFFIVVNWVLVVKHFKYTSFIFFRNAVVLVIIAAVFSIVKLDLFTEKSMVWTFIFLLMGGIKLLFEKDYAKDSE